MRIGFISPTFPPDHCGVGDHSFKLCEALKNLGHEVQLFRELPSLAKLQTDFSVLFIQYTPNLWANNILKQNKELQKFLKVKSTIKKIIMAHELHYPIQLTARGLLYGVGQWIQFQRLFMFADWVCFSYQSPQNHYSTHSSVLPVGSNILYSPIEKTHQVNSISPIRLVHFGGAHPTHLIEWTLKVHREVKKAFPEKKN